MDKGKAAAVISQRELDCHTPAASSAKIVLEPTVRVVESRGFNARELRVLTGLASDRAGSIRRAWNDHFG